MSAFAIVSNYDNNGVYSYYALALSSIDQKINLVGREKIEGVCDCAEDWANCAASTDKLRHLYNGLTTGEKVKKFTNKATAARRLFELLVSVAMQPSAEQIATAPVAVEAPVATKAKKTRAKAEKPAKTEKAPKEANAERVRSRKPTSGEADVFKAYGVFGGSNRATLLKRLLQDLNSAIPFKACIAAIYGTEDMEFAAMTRKVLLGLFLIQEKTDLLFEVRKIKTSEGVSYGLFFKGNPEA